MVQNNIICDLQFRCIYFSCKFPILSYLQNSQILVSSNSTYSKTLETTLFAYILRIKHKKWIFAKKNLLPVSFPVSFPFQKWVRKMIRDWLSGSMTTSGCLTIDFDHFRSVPEVLVITKSSSGKFYVGVRGVIFEFQEWLLPLKCILEAFGTGVPARKVTVK